MDGKIILPNGVELPVTNIQIEALNKPSVKEVVVIGTDTIRSSKAIVKILGEQKEDAIHNRNG